MIQRGLLLKGGTAIGATSMVTPTSTKNKGKACGPEMHCSKTGNQWFFCMKAHIGVDAESSLVHTVRGTCRLVIHVSEANTLLYGQEKVAFGVTGYQEIDKPLNTKACVTWHVAM